MIQDTRVLDRKQLNERMKTMKWSNKGHEFDKAYEEMTRKTKWYLFGAGEYGSFFVDMMKDEINISGYIDNSLDKQHTIINGYECFAYTDIQITEEVGIIVTPSQIPRIHIVRQLEENGLVRNRDFFVIEDFFGIYYAYKKGKVFFSTISMLPSTLCNLNCALCLNFNPYAKHPDIRPLDKVKADIDTFFRCVDYVMLFHVSGGETFLYKDLPAVVSYLDEQYGDRIKQLRVVSNGTVIPKDEVLEELSKHDFDINLDDYRDAVPQFSDNFKQICEKLDKYNIKYNINWTDEWIDLDPMNTDHSSWNDEQLENHFRNCNQNWQELRDGKLFLCNYSSYASVAGINDLMDSEVYDLTRHTPDRIKELVEFRLGYSEKGYASFCKKCRGFNPENGLVQKAAIQMERKA